MSNYLEEAMLKCPGCKEVIHDRTVKKVYATDLHLVYHEPCRTVLGVLPDKVKVEE